MKGIRRKEKAIEDIGEIQKIIMLVKHVTIALCDNNEPYLVTINHGYDPDNNKIFFHCANEGKKIDILAKNNVVWGQALLDKGYVQGECDYKYATAQFKGKVTFLEDFDEKKAALISMIYKLDADPEKLMKEQLTEKAINNVKIGCIDIDYLSGKIVKGVEIS
ncbi:MAG: hypothetical protein FK734_14415 [Asgard group archaeon]|nr:hypothetical protein [Asgard group archaeon]